VNNTGSILYFDGGDYQNPTRKFRFSGYVSKGVRNMPVALPIRVDGGATLDFSSVEGGQSVNAITVDLAVGSGAIINARAASGGTLYVLSNESVIRPTNLPIKCSDFMDADNFRSWKVVVNGKTRQGWNVVANGDTLSIVPPGTVVVIR
jgi:hypothetical protein